MKNYLLFVFAFLLLVGCNQSQQNNKEDSAPPVDKTIIFIRLIDEIPEDETNIYPYIQLYDNDGNISKNNKTSIEKFTSPVYAGKKVKWKSSKKSIEKIKVKKISFKQINGSIDVLDNQNISTNKDEVERIVKTNLKEGDEEHYSIDIVIDGNPYTIDPVLKFHDN